jgi:hypothetical protein
MCFKNQYRLGTAANEVQDLDGNISNCGATAGGRQELHHYQPTIIVYGRLKQLFAPTSTSCCRQQLQLSTYRDTGTCTCMWVSLPCTTIGKLGTEERAGYSKHVVHSCKHSGKPAHLWPRPGKPPELPCS